MSIFEKVKELFGGEDALEWDSSDPAGDETAYDKDYASETPYNHKEFVKEELKDGN